METDLNSLKELDREYVLHPFTPAASFASGGFGGPRVMASGVGIRLRDTDGVESIDAFSGLYCVNVGYGREEIAAAIYEQAQNLAYYHSYAGHSNAPSIKLSEKIIQMAPPGMRKVFYGLSGSDANETQVKLVWYYNNVRGRPNKKKIISRRRGYHGASIWSGSLTGLDFYHQAFDLPVSGVLHTTSPHYFWDARRLPTERDFSRACAEDLEALILAEGSETIGGFIAEPVLGTGGLIPPPEGYWEEIQKVLLRHEILLIVDEVVCGFGRTGAAFGSTLYDIKPDLITVAKGLTSAYAPLSAVIIGERVWNALRDGERMFQAFPHGYTYTAHPICVAAGLANLNIIEREGLVENARDVGVYFQKALHDVFGDMPHVAEVRGVGLMGAIEFARDPAARRRFEPQAQVGARLAAACLANGVIVRAMPHGDILGFAPPLIVTRADIDEIVERVRRAVCSVDI